MTPKLTVALEREALELGLKLRPEFVDGEASVRPPILPSICRRFSGAVRIPKVFLKILTKKEVRCVFLHEVAHVKFRHFLKDAVFAAVLLSLALVLCLGNVVVFLPAVFAIGVLTLAFHRRFEYQADVFAADRVSVEAMVGVLSKLGKRYGEGGPFYRVSHPSIAQRIRKLKLGDG